MALPSPRPPPVTRATLEDRSHDAFKSSAAPRFAGGPHRSAIRAYPTGLRLSRARRAPEPEPSEAVEALRRASP
jgi:hypothetical protein